jgi:rhodanese-related sulfurtransferase
LKTNQIFFQGFGFEINEILNVTPREAFELCKNGVLLVDVREDYLNKMKCFAVDEIINIPLSQLLKEENDIPKDRPMIFADSTGLRSKEAVKILQEKGYRNIANLAGGIVEWESEGLPVLTERKERLSGSCFCQLKNRE